jgi:hypothetical protein
MKISLLCILICSLTYVYSITNSLDPFYGNVLVYSKYKDPSNSAEVFVTIMKFDSFKLTYEKKDAFVKNITTLGEAICSNTYYNTNRMLINNTQNENETYSMYFMMPNINIVYNQMYKLVKSGFFPDPTYNHSFPYIYDYDPNLKLDYVDLTMIKAYYDSISETVTIYEKYC